MRSRIARILNARRFGLWFVRNRWFSLPKSVRINNRRHILTYPTESGVPNDFLACVIWNEYGLAVQMPQPKTIVDVGANVGFFSLAARNYYPDARIHSYEPNPKVLPFLPENTRGLNIEIFDEAVGSTEGFVSLDDSGDSNQVTSHQVAHSSIRQVSFSTLLNRVGGPIDLLKLDCEGAEWDLFKAGDCWKSVRHIRMEYHLFDSHTFAELSLTLERLGFRIVDHRPSVNFGMVWARR
jgi:FkbM family methyltransferase